MARKLKVYQTSQGFYDLAIAAPSMKAALEAWGAGTNWFQQGFAQETADAKVISAALGKPGKVLRRPVGSNGLFAENSKLPTAAALEAALPRQPKPQPPAPKAKAPKLPKLDEKAQRQAAALYEKEQAKRDRQRQKEEAAATKAQERRTAAVQKTQAAMDLAMLDHEGQINRIDDDRASLDRREKAENERWSKVHERLKADLRRARGE